MACACFPAGASAVVHGTSASAGQWPWVARIVAFDRANVEICSGSVIAPNVVLTAGHCTVDEKTRTLLPASDYYVTTGTTNWLSSPGQVSAVSRVVLYPGWSTSGGVSDRDAALLQLETRTTAPALPLATPSTDAGLYAAGTAAEVAGWGRTAGRNTLLPVGLQWTTTAVQSTPWCQTEAQNDLGESFDPVNEMCTIAAPTDSAGTCWGDSGGPLVALSPGGAVVEIGIASWMATGCTTTAPDFFQPVAAISSWLSREMADLSAPATTIDAASDVGRSTATLAGRVNPNDLPTRYYFQYGTTSSYGSMTTARNVDGITAAPVSATLHDLKPGTVYRYRLVAMSANGTSDSVDKRFATPPAPKVGTYQAKAWQGWKLGIKAAPNQDKIIGMSSGFTERCLAYCGPLGYTFTPNRLLPLVAPTQGLMTPFSYTNTGRQLANVSAQPTAVLLGRRYGIRMPTH